MATYIRILTTLQKLKDFQLMMVLKSIGLLLQKTEHGTIKVKSLKSLTTKLCHNSQHRTSVLCFLILKKDGFPSLNKLMI